MTSSNGESRTPWHSWPEKDDDSRVGVGLPGPRLPRRAFESRHRVDYGFRDEPLLDREPCCRGEVVLDDSA